MKKIKNVSVIGLGAIGGSYAAKLFDTGSIDFTVIADSSRIGKYSTNKLTVNGKPYDFNFIRPEDDGAYADLILIAVKYHNLSQAVDAIRKRIGPDTIIMSLLNGIDSEEILGGAFGMEKLLYSSCVGIDAVRNANDIRYTSFGKLYFGESLNKLQSERVERVKALFDEAGIPYVIPEDMVKAIWWKYMINIGVNQASAVLGATYGVFRNISEAHELIDSAMREVIAVSAKAGVGLREGDIAEAHRVLGTLSADGKTSMLQDMEAGRKTEVEMLSGVLCEMGRKYGVPTPVNDTLFKMIRTLEQMKSWC
ncbi:MAG TPA: ketopantoate reductase family protein [Clostridia bacterium]|nr:ketopantoate reductase family protein [Clostridia bacterium]